MFYNNDGKYENDFENIFNTTYVGDGLSVNYSEQSGGINYILENYNNHEIRVRELVDDFRDSSTYGLENQILDLFNNVKNLLISKDTNLIKNSIESITQGKENALRFIEEQGNLMDSRTIDIMNSIVNEYSYHINYLNEAINILSK